MKKLLTIVALVSLFFGCDQGTDISSPGKIDNLSYQFIELPKKSGMSVETTFSITKEIDGDKGGEIKLKEKYETEDGNKVKIDVKLKVKKKSFQGKVKITLTIDDEFAAVCFTPHMVFNGNAELYLKFEGLDLTGINPNNVNFIFKKYWNNFSAISFVCLIIA